MLTVSQYACDFADEFGIFEYEDLNFMKAKYTFNGIPAKPQAKLPYRPQ